MSNKNFKAGFKKGVKKSAKTNIKRSVLVVGFLLFSAVFAGESKTEVDMLQTGVCNKCADVVDTNNPKSTSLAKGSSETKTSERKTEKDKKDKKGSKGGASTPRSTSKSKRAKRGIKETSFSDNEQIKVILSNRDVNRVLVKEDKIISVNGPAGLYTAKNDVAGSAYISLYGDAAFTLFASTVKGHNFSLLVSPRSIAGKTVILKSTTPSLSTARWEEAESYQKVLVTLITGMINSEPLGDYSYSEIKNPKVVDFYRVARIKPLVFYGGSHLTGIVSEIKNKSRKPLILKPSYFYKFGVRAVALSQQTLRPSETGLLYQVMGR